ncbi:MAG: DUF4203 domain-containing protein [Candidatus Krumholzibacteriota bacterium]|nr:DUF4203 domain-containing protein [Candidatus Krumholzibacteriota bacterium]
MNTGALNGYAVISVLFGAVSCFWGYRAFRAVLGIIGFITGAWLAGGVTATFTGGIGIVALIAGVAGGLIVGSIFVTLYYMGIFIVGAAAGWLSCVMMASMAGNGMNIILFIILAAAGGILAVSFQRFVLTVSTAVIGAWYIVTGILLFFRSALASVVVFRVPGQVVLPDIGSRLIVLLSWFFLALSGVVFQYRFSGQKRSGKK